LQGRTVAPEKAGDHHAGTRSSLEGSAQAWRASALNFSASS
jgi:hypothetical protein